MKKHSIIVFMLALSLMAAPVGAEGKVDLVVLLDSSKSMFQYYNQVIDYVLTETVREFLRFGDSFHLMSFSDSTQLEIAQTLRTEPDLKSVIARLYLLYPLGRNTDLVTALKNVYGYVDDLPTENTKHIILITDGMHSPAPGSPYSNLDVPGVRDEIDRAAVRIRERGWTMRIVRVPFSPGATPAESQDPASTAGTSGTSGSPGGVGEADPSSPGTGDYLADVAAAVGQDIQTFDPENHAASVGAGVDLHRIVFPAELGVEHQAFTMQVEVSNGSDLRIPLELTGLLLEDGTDILVRKVSAELAPGTSVSLSLKLELPDTMPAGQTRLLLEPRFNNDFRVTPARSAVNLTLKKSLLPAFFGNSGGIVLLILILLITCAAILALLLYIRRAHRKAEEPIVDALLDSATPERSKAGAPAGLEARAVHQGTLQQASVNSRDSAMAQAAKLSAANAPDASARRRLESLNAASSQRHTIPENVLAARESSSRDMAQAASVLGSWNAPGSSRKTLPLVPEDSSRIKSAASRAPMHFEPRITRPGAVRLIMHVKDQNPKIGKRNIRPMHAGGRASVGGGKSAFLIFLLPVPRNLAHLHYDGIDATLVPQKPEFFPDYNSPVESCIGRDIRVVTVKGKELIIRFERYVPPLDRINKLLHCLETPGMTIGRTDLYAEQDRAAEQV